jgi:hypothetical protein
MAAKTGTYTLINSTTLSTAATSVSFSSIPGTYTDLVIVFSGTSTALAGINIQFNGDTATNYSRTVLDGNGSAASSSRETSQVASTLGLSSTTQSDTIFHIFDYANTTTYKTILSRANVSASLVRAAVGLWRSTSAVTSITLSYPTFNSGSTFKLYGIEAGNL